MKVISNKWRLKWPDIKKTLTAASYAFIGGGLAYLAEYFNTINLDEYQVFLAGTISVLSYLAKKLITRSEY